MTEKRLKILFISLEYNKAVTGGIGRVLNSLAPPIAQKVELDIILAHHSLYVIKWFKLYRIRNNRPELKCSNLFRPKILTDILAEENYDAVHIFHTQCVCSEAIKIIKEKFPQLKIFYSCHSIAKYDHTIRGNDPDLLKQEDYIIHHVDHIHLLNQASKKYFNQVYGSLAQNKASSIIPNGIDEAAFREKDFRFRQKMERLLKGKFTVLCMSRWSRGKGLEFLLEAIPKITARYDNIQFVIAGRRWMSWEYKYREYIKEIAGKMAALGEYVIPLGWLNDEQRNTIFEFADLWVMPSLLEYFPYSILEPMIAQIPIVSANLDCLWEMLQDNEECLFYEPQNSDQLADKIITLIHNPELRQKLAANAYQKAKECYQWCNISEMYLKMYQDVLETSAD